MSKTSGIQRIAAVLALVGAVVAVYLLLSGGSSYKVTAEFENASQLVTGNTVVIGGTTVGKVDTIELGENGQALVTFNISESGYTPLPLGTKATVRSFSLSGQANRNIQLTLPAEGESEGEIENGGTLPREDAISEVDLDQLFNTLDNDTVADLKKVIRGMELSYEGVAKDANEGFKYLNPFISTSRRLFDELTFDGRRLEQLIVDGAQISGALAERRDDVSQLVGNLDTAMGALANRKVELAESVRRLPGFVRRFNTTAVNLRSTLDDVDPLVDASKPVARELQDFLPDLRVTARNLVPTVRDLDKIVKDPGRDNDLVDLNRLQPRLANIAIGPVDRNGATRDGAFPEAAQALRDGLPQLAFLRAYSPELTGWFNDFGTSGIVDANGGIGRIGTTFNAFTVSDAGVPIVDPFNSLGNNFEALTGDELEAAFNTDNLEKCPGANERPAADGSNPFTDGGKVDCDPNQFPPGE